MLLTATRLGSAGGPRARPHEAAPNAEACRIGLIVQNQKDLDSNSSAPLTNPMATGESLNSPHLCFAICQTGLWYLPRREGYDDLCVEGPEPGPQCAVSAEGVGAVISGERLTVANR